MTFVPRQLKSEKIPSFNLGWRLHVCKTEVKSSDSSKQFTLVQLSARTLAWFPSFELPLMTWDYNSHYTSPSGLRKWYDVIIDVKCDFPSTYFALYCYWLRAVSWVFDILASFKELLDIANAKATGCEALRHDDDWMRGLLKLLSYRSKAFVLPVLFFVISSNKLIYILCLKIWTSKVTSFAIGPRWSILLALNSLIMGLNTWLLLSHLI